MTEKSIAEDWMVGDRIIVSKDLVVPILEARSALEGFDHEDAVRLWEELYEVCNQWKRELGQVPNMLGIPRKFDDIYPWQAKDGWFPGTTDVVDFLLEDLASYPPYSRLEQRVGRKNLLAVSVLWSACSLDRNQAELIGWKAAHQMLRDDFLIVRDIISNPAILSVPTMTNRIIRKVTMRTEELINEEHTRHRVEAAKRAASVSAERRYMNASDLWRKIKIRAQELWLDSPLSTNRDIAERLAEEFNRKASTIEKKIGPLLGALRREWRTASKKPSSY